MGAITRQLVLTIVAASVAAAAEPTTVYYAVFEGRNYDRETWKVGDLKAFKASRPENVFDSYTFERLPDGKSKVVREFATPSGDWFATLTYFYSNSGRLTRILYDFR